MNMLNIQNWYTSVVHHISSSLIMRVLVTITMYMSFFSLLSMESFAKASQAFNSYVMCVSCMYLENIEEIYKEIKKCVTIRMTKYSRVYIYVDKKACSR